jgi:hypothetical protein
MEQLQSTKIGEVEDHDDTTNTIYWEIIQCPVCQKTLLRERYWNDIHDDGSELHCRIIYPQPDSERKNIDILPNAIKKEYVSAKNIQLVDSNAFAVLLGRVLEKILIDKKAKGNTLNEKLDNLASSGLVPKTIIEAAHGIRQLRNIGAHAELGDLTKDEIPILKDIISIILEYLYFTPDLIKQVSERVRKLKEDNIKVPGTENDPGG